MKYSDEELKIIYDKRPDLIRKPAPSTNNAVIEFLKRYGFVSKMNKNLTSKEWKSIKQKALDHRDFPKFQTDYFNEVIEFNQKIDEKLKDPQTQEELDFFIKKYSISERIRQYMNPQYFYSKYQNNNKVRKYRKSYRVYKLFWICFIFALSVVLIIFSFQK